MSTKQKGGALVWIIVVIVVLIVAFAYLNKGEESADKMMTDEISQESEMTTESTENMMEDGDFPVMEIGETPSGDDSLETGTVEAGIYEEYAPEKFTNADGRIVLFFHAKWCPTCRGLDSAINASLDQIPSGLTILKTDYDTYTDLKKKYGIRMQHTLVQVDNNGNEIAKWSGGSDLDSILEKLQ